MPWVPGGTVFTYEVDADGGDVGLGIGVVGESQEKARLSNTGVTDEEQLEEVVVSVRVGGQLGLVRFVEHLAKLGFGSGAKARRRVLMKRHDGGGGVVIGSNENG